MARRRERTPPTPTPHPSGDYEDVQVAFIGGISDGEQLLIRFPVGLAADGDHYTISKGDRMHIYRFEQVPGTAKVFRAVFVSIRSA